MKKDQMITEYISLCQKYINFCGPDPVDDLDFQMTVKKIHQLRHDLGMDPITLGGINGEDIEKMKIHRLLQKENEANGQTYNSAK